MEEIYRRIVSEFLKYYNDVQKRITHESLKQSRYVIGAGIIVVAVQGLTLIGVTGEFGEFIQAGSVVIFIISIIATLLWMFYKYYPVHDVRQERYKYSYQADQRQLSQSIVNNLKGESEIQISNPEIYRNFLSSLCIYCEDNKEKRTDPVSHFLWNAFVILILPGIFGILSASEDNQEVRQYYTLYLLVVSIAITIAFVVFCFLNNKKEQRISGYYRIISCANGLMLSGKGDKTAGHIEERLQIDWEEEFKIYKGKVWYHGNGPLDKGDYLHDFEQYSEWKKEVIRKYCQKEETEALWYYAKRKKEEKRQWLESFKVVIIPLVFVLIPLGYGCLSSNINNIPNLSSIYFIATGLIVIICLIVFAIKVKRQQEEESFFNDFAAILQAQVEGDNRL